MTGRLAHAWERVRSSLWFVPLGMVGGAAVLAIAMLHLDADLPDGWGGNSSWLYVRSEASSRTLVSTVASSMITAAGVAFSVMMVALQLASSQFGPRLLRNFMRDLGNQLVLGTFLATFVYCLLVMRTLGTGLADDVAPRVSVTVAVALALVSLGVLIYFIHHADASMQAPNVIAAVASELRGASERMYPAHLGVASPADRSWHPAGPGADVASAVTGYLQRIDGEMLTRAAQRSNAVVVLRATPGDFVVAGDRLGSVWPSTAAPHVFDAVRNGCLIGHRRTAEQDIRFTIDQLVEITVRAMSPGINDPFTARTCIEHLAAALADLATRQLPASGRRDEEGRIRVVASRPTFADLLDMATAPVRQVSGRNQMLLVAMLGGVEVIARRATTADVRGALEHHARLTAAPADPGLLADDREQVTSAFERVRLTLGGHDT